MMEMLAGRDALKRSAVEDNDGYLPVVWQWAGQGELFLRNQFDRYGLAFTTNVERDHIVLTVYRRNHLNETLAPLFSVREKAMYFVSTATLAKIMLVV